MKPCPKCKQCGGDAATRRLVYGKLCPNGHHRIAQEVLDLACGWYEFPEWDVALRAAVARLREGGERQ